MSSDCKAFRKTRSAERELKALAKETYSDAELAKLGIVRGGQLNLDGDWGGPWLPSRLLSASSP